MKRIIFTLITLILLSFSFTSYATEINTSESTDVTENTTDDIIVIYSRDDGDVLRTETVKKGSKIVLSDPEPRIGLIFKGYEIHPENVDLNNINLDNSVFSSIEIQEKWEIEERYHPVDDPIVYQKEEEQLEKQKELNDKISKFTEKYNKFRNTKPKLTISKSKITVKTKKYATDANIIYSRNEDFSNYKTVKIKIKNGKGVLKANKLKKKLKKNKKYYIAVYCMVCDKETKYSIMSKQSKAIAIKRK